MSLEPVARTARRILVNQILRAAGVEVDGDSQPSPSGTAWSGQRHCERRGGSTATRCRPPRTRRPEAAIASNMTSHVKRRCCPTEQSWPARQRTRPWAQFGCDAMLTKRSATWRRSNQTQLTTRPRQLQTPASASARPDQQHQRLISKSTQSCHNKPLHFRCSLTHTRACGQPRSLHNPGGRQSSNTRGFIRRAPSPAGHTWPTVRHRPVRLSPIPTRWPNHPVWPTRERDRLPSHKAMSAPQSALASRPSSAVPCPRASPTPTTSRPSPPAVTLPKRKGAVLISISTSQAQLALPPPSSPGPRTTLRSTQLNPPLSGAPPLSLQLGKRFARGYISSTRPATRGPALVSRALALAQQAIHLSGGRPLAPTPLANQPNLAIYGEEPLASMVCAPPASWQHH